MSGECLKLAEWEGLGYYMIEEDSKGNHIILVRDDVGNKGNFILESGKKVDGNLEDDQLVKISSMLRDFRGEFLSYYRSFRDVANA